MSKQPSNPWRQALGVVSRSGAAGRQALPAGNVWKKTMVNADVNIMEYFADSDELSMFKTSPLQKFIEFKWHSIGSRHHCLSAVVHCLYVVLLVLYVLEIYILNPNEGTSINVGTSTPAGAGPENGAAEQEGLGRYSHPRNYYALLLLACMALPLTYEIAQVRASGIAEHLTELENYVDLSFIVFSIANSLYQYLVSAQDFIAKVLAILVIILTAFRTLKYLRIFRSFSPIVTMMMKVVIQLKAFLLFFLILLAFVSLLIGIVGVQNIGRPGAFRNQWFGQPRYPGSEYKHVHPMLAHFLVVFRAALGDYSIVAAAQWASTSDAILFWLVWLVVVVYCCIMFLNFVIAEACSSYEHVAQHLDAVMEKDRANLISEAESMTPFHW